ncbi:MAG: hypothetical protein DSZ28_04985 [Thiothrix sp.]|nr:MAG: hypothetical protein DSZ28_04985 [Thiothrix sp.]
MAFIMEPTGYEKTAISDLQGSWGNLRNAVIDNFGFTDSDKLIFHINEAMSWESVRDLKLMKTTFILVQNIVVQTNAPNEVIEWLDDVRESLDAVFDAIAEGKAK